MNVQTGWLEGAVESYQGIFKLFALDDEGSCANDPSSRVEMLVQADK